MIGMPPATAASKATITPLAWAAAKISLPCFASSALLAVTTCLPLAMAASTSSLARVSPPISSTTMSMSGSRRPPSRVGDELDARQVHGARLRQVLRGGHGDDDLAAGAARDLLAVAAQHLDGAAADGAEAEQADVDRFHGSLLREVEGADDEALAEIELVRLLALACRNRARARRSRARAPTRSMKAIMRLARAPRAPRLVGHEVVAVELAPGEGLLDHAEDRHAHDARRRPAATAISAPLAKTSLHAAGGSPPAGAGAAGGARARRRRAAPASATAPRASVTATTFNADAVLAEHLLDAAHRLARAALVLDERDADVVVAVVAEADARRDRDLGVLQELLGELDGAHRRRSARGSSPRRTSRPSGSRPSSPPRAGPSPSRRGGSGTCARISSTHSCGPSSATMEATWIGVKVP